MLLNILLYLSYLTHPWNFQTLFLYDGFMFLAFMLMGRVMCFLVKLVWGGTTKPHSEAQEDAWNKILAFLQTHLYSTVMPRAKM